MKILFLFFFILFFVGGVARADEFTHQLGNSLYAIRAARLECAFKRSPDYYFRAVRAQMKAQKKFANRALVEATHLSLTAEREAKLALKEAKGDSEERCFRE